MLSITVDWSVVEIREDGSAHMRPLEPGEDYTAGNLVPRFTIQAAGTTLSYPIDPSLPQGILRLNSNEITCVFIPVKGLDNSQLIELWDGIALTNLEKEVLNALRLIAPGVEVLTFVSTPVSVGKRIPIVKIADIDRPLLLSTLGDGMQRTLSIALALANAKNGMLLIDEFENGLYYSVQPDVWRFIFRLAGLLNVQVFAATHSLDCIQAFQRAAEEDSQAEGILVRLDTKDKDVRAVVFDEEE